MKFRQLILTFALGFIAFSCSTDDNTVDVDTEVVDPVVVFEGVEEEDVSSNGFVTSTMSFTSVNGGATSQYNVNYESGLAVLGFNPNSGSNSQNVFAYDSLARQISWVSSNDSGVQIEVDYSYANSGLYSQIIRQDYAQDRTTILNFEYEEDYVNVVESIVEDGIEISNLIRVIYVDDDGRIIRSENSFYYYDFVYNESGDILSVETTSASSNTLVRQDTFSYGVGEIDFGYNRPDGVGIVKQRAMLSWFGSGYLLNTSFFVSISQFPLESISSLNTSSGSSQEVLAVSYTTDEDNRCLNYEQVSVDVVSGSQTVTNRNFEY
jgi:hypothetical protein